MSANQKPDPAEIGKAAAIATVAAIESAQPQIRFDAGVLTALAEIVALLVKRGLLSADETLSALEAVSTSILLRPDGVAGALAIELLRKQVAEQVRPLTRM